MAELDQLIEKARTFARERANQAITECITLCAEHGLQPTQELLTSLLTKPEEKRAEFLLRVKASQA